MTEEDSITKYASALMLHGFVEERLRDALFGLVLETAEVDF
jgi:hypothetical protein